MKSSRWFVLTVLMWVTFAQAETPAPAPQQADVPARKVGPATKSVEHFDQLHEKFVKQAKEGNIDLLFLGDSITEGWGGGGKATWAKYYADKKAANFGISGDRTQHVLWRLENGELENIHPKVCVLMIGTNNIGGSAASSDPADRIAKGVKMIVDEVREKTSAKVLLLGIFPRGMDPKDEKVIAVRARVKEVNDIIAKLDDGKNVKYLDISEKFLEADGTLPKSIMPDALHPNAKGYEIWAEAIEAPLAEMLK